MNLKLKLKWTVFTLFPEMFDPVLKMGRLGQAITDQVIEAHLVNLREFSDDDRGRIDDRPYGGGDGMVFCCDPLERAWRCVADAQQQQEQQQQEQQQQMQQSVRCIALSARGRPFTDAMAREWAREGSEIWLLCGRYAGFDQRWVEARGFEEVSVGDYVLTGGEIPAMLIMDAVTRLLPGVLGHPESSEVESLSPSLGGALEAPAFTRPRDWQGWIVPEKLLSGDHAQIELWRKNISLFLTAEKRPELLHPRQLYYIPSIQKKKKARSTAPDVSPFDALDTQLGFQQKDLQSALDWLLKSWDQLGEKEKKSCGLKLTRAELESRLIQGLTPFLTL